MDDSTGIHAQDPHAGGRSWLLLIHQIPPKPDYFRVKVRRRLRRLGALALKNSVYALPAVGDAMEDLRWLARGIREEGGEALVCEAAFVDGLSNEEVSIMLRSARDEEYQEIIAAASSLAERVSAAKKIRPERRAELALRASRLRRRLGEVQSTDALGAASRDDAERAVEGLERALRSAPSASARGAPGAALSGRTWVTRRDVHIDRIASAWLIRRFIDPASEFKFVAPRGYQPSAAEVRFDMYDAEHTHRGDDCTFETLLADFALDDRALRTIAEIVHDIDCKDEKFGRGEVAGVAMMIDGIVRSHEEDAERLARGAAALDDVYAALRARRR